MRVITRQSFFSKYRGYILGATPIAILLVGVAVTYSLVNRQNDIRTRASLLERDVNKVYDDALIPGWEDKSWEANNTFNLSSPVFSGEASIAFVNKKADSGFYLKRQSPLVLPFWAQLEFALQAGNNAGNYSVSIVNEGGSQIGNKILLSSLEDNLQMGEWKNYSIFLTSFGLIDQPIGGIIIRDESGGTGNTVYIDEIKFEIRDRYNNFLQKP